MSEVKKIIINGNEYTVSDGGAVAFDAAQGLTDEQKAQARENVNAAAVHIGADEPTDESVTLWVDTDEDSDSGSSVLTVTITDGVASHTSTEIYAHVQAGGTVVLEHNGEFLALSHLTRYEASFSWINGEEAVTTHIAIYDDGSFDNYAPFALASAEFVLGWAYSKTEIDAMFGSYISDIDTLLGGDS